ncbi:MAG: uroporphyrinogen decarboxylase family protein [Bacillota bacterium]
MNERFLEKRKRIDDAIALKKPDRVPFFLLQNYMPARTEGLAYKDVYYNIDGWVEANRKFIQEYDPDMYFMIDAPGIGAGPVHDILGTVAMRWPGGTLPDNISHQFVEGEYMLQGEYDHFLDDPSDYLLRVFTPRVFSNLQGLTKLPSLKVLSLGCYGTTVYGMALSNPEVLEALQRLMEMAKPATEFAMKVGMCHAEMLEHGQICASAAPTLHPYDIISDMLRGMRGTMIDMFKVPDKLIAALEKLYPISLGSAIGVAQATGNKQIFIPLHRGADGFMSPKQFEKFYWPFLKQLICDLVDAGLTPMPFFEGTYEQRIDYLTELPAGKCIGWFDRSDLKLLKEKLGDVMCVAGGMPASLLQTGTAEIVREQTKEAIDIFGKAGLIMTASTVIDEAKPELLRAWVDATREFGS